MRKLLWVGDAVVSSGFARCTHEILDTLCQTWTVGVLGLNYMGDPHPFKYPIWPCYPGGDLFGVNRIKDVVQGFEPDLIVIQNDPWNFPAYLDKLIDVKIPIVGVVAVDGLNCRGKDLSDRKVLYRGEKRTVKGLSHAIFWTEYGRDQARIGGYTGPADVIGLGVDLSIYFPQDRTVALDAVFGTVGGSTYFGDKFIVGNVNRNQPRKRLDLTVSYFAEWVREYGIDDAYLFAHVAPTGDTGYDLIQLMHYYGFKGENKRLLLTNPDLGYGVTEAELAASYSCMDIQVSTTQGEGWGLPHLEGMACCVPQLLPRWSALGEWATAALFADCNEIVVTPDTVNVIGGVPDRKQWIQQLDNFYRNRELRVVKQYDSLMLATQPQFRWRNIGLRYDEVLTEVLQRQEVAA